MDLVIFKDGGEFIVVQPGIEESSIQVVSTNFTSVAGVKKFLDSCKAHERQLSVTYIAAENALTPQEMRELAERH